MKKCPICKNAFDSLSKCKTCGYEEYKDFTEHRTIASVPLRDVDAYLKVKAWQPEKQKKHVEKSDIKINCEETINATDIQVDNIGVEEPAAKPVDKKSKLKKWAKGKSYAECTKGEKIRSWILVIIVILQVLLYLFEPAYPGF